MYPLLSIVITAAGTVVSALPGAVPPPATRQVRAPQPPEPLSTGDPATDAILDRLETKGKAITDLRAQVKKTRIDLFPVKDTQIQSGQILFRRLQPNPKFRVRFDKLIAAGIVREETDWYLFDGQWLIERHDKTRRVIKKQQVAAGERIDVFKLGQGPFPLPFGQSRHDMLSTFTITRTAPRPDDPPNTDHLVCISRPGSDLAGRYTKVHFYVDRRLELPVRIVAEKAKDDRVIQVDFTDIEVNVGLAASEFEIEVPAGYTVTVEPLPPKSPPLRRPS